MTSEISFKDKSNIEKVASVFFYTALIIEILIVIIDKSAYINPIEGRLFQITFALCVLKIAMTKYNLKEWLLILAFMSLGLFMDQWTDKNEAIRFIAFIAASKGIDGKKAMKVVFYITLAGCLLLVALSIMGIYGTTYLEADYYRGSGIERRYCLGMGHPNALHCMFWALVTLGIYLYLDSIKWYHYAVIAVVNIILFILTKSRIGMIVTMFTVLLGVVATYYKKLREQKWVYILAIIGFVLCVAFSVLCAFYDGFGVYGYREQFSFLGGLDQKLTGRIIDSSFTGHITKWTLFSKKEVIGLMDMGYIKLFYRYGIVPAIVYIVSIILLIIRSHKNNDIAATLLIVSFVIYNVMEAHIISPYFARNYMLMLFFGVWSEVFFTDKGTDGYFWQVNKILNK